MIKLLRQSTKKRPITYYDVKCPFCECTAIFEFKDIKMVDVKNQIGKIKCPTSDCKMNIYFKFHGYPVEEIHYTSRNSYDLADNGCCMYENFYRR